MLDHVSIPVTNYQRSKGFYMRVLAPLGYGLVLEVAFEGLNRSTRHRSGVAMRFPRISRLRWDKPAREADRIEALTALLGEEAPQEKASRKSKP